MWPVLRRFKRKQTAQIPSKTAPVQWFNAGDVLRLSFAKHPATGEPVKIGSGHYSTVYTGRIHFKTEQGITRRRVAIKVYNSQLTPEQADGLQRTIDLLRVGKVPYLPKMGLYCLTNRDSASVSNVPAGTWVVVSQLFGSSKRGSKVPYRISETSLSRSSMDKLIKIGVAVANQGLRPALDLSVVSKNQSFVVPLDLDGVRLASDKSNASTLLSLIECITPQSGTREKRRLLKLALREAKPGLKAFLERQEQWL